MEAAQLSISTAAMTGDEFYVIENDPSGSMHYVAGSAAVLGGVYPTPQEIFNGPGFAPGPTSTGVKI
jgi:hypothetical protein